MFSLLNQLNFLVEFNEANQFQLIISGYKLGVIFFSSVLFLLIMLVFTFKILLK